VTFVEEITNVVSERTIIIVILKNIGYREIRRVGVSGSWSQTFQSARRCSTDDMCHVIMQSRDVPAI
jgi:hypothetical protein